MSTSFLKKIWFQTSFFSFFHIGFSIDFPNIDKAETRNKKNGNIEIISNVGDGWCGDEKKHRSQWNTMSLLYTSFRVKWLYEYISGSR